MPWPAMHLLARVRAAERIKAETVVSSFSAALCEAQDALRYLVAEYF